MPKLLAKLPESSRRRRGAVSRAGTAASVAAHASLITLAVVATSRGAVAPKPPKPIDSRVIWIPTPPPPQPPTTTQEKGSGRQLDGTRPRTTSGESPMPRWPAPSGPIEVKLSVGPVGGTVVGDDLGHTATSGSGGGMGVGADGGMDAPFDARVVEVAAALRPGARLPRYPEELRGARLEGRVLARFVVDTLGRIEPSSVRILSSTHPLFTDAVRATLPTLRFTPARARGTKVRQLVELPFEFAMER